MTGFDLVVDTNILIYLTAGNKNIAEVVRDKNLIISFITEMEMRSWPSLTVSDIQTLKKLLSKCRVIGLNDDIKEKAIEIRKSTRLKLPDAIVSATAIFLGLPLVSADNDLKRVKDPQMIHLYETLCCSHLSQSHHQCQYLFFRRATF